MWRLATVGLAFAVSAFPWQNTAPATITDSGSTNRAGFTITVDPSGTAEIRVHPRRFDAQQTPAKPIRRGLPADLVGKFFAELKAAAPLEALPASHCAKSASFGSTLTVSLGGRQTPDLSCGDNGNPALRELIEVVQRIVALANVQDMRLKREVR